MLLITYLRSVFDEECLQIHIQSPSARMRALSLLSSLPYYNCVDVYKPAVRNILLNSFRSIGLNIVHWYKQLDYWSG